MSEQNVSFVFCQGRMPSCRLKWAGRFWLMILGVGLLSMSGNAVNAQGQLSIANRVDASIGSMTIQHVDGASEDPNDLFDVVWLIPPAGSSLYSQTDTVQLSTDSRPQSNSQISPIHLVYDGQVAHTRHNQLEVSFPAPGQEFGARPITIELSSGRRVDIRQAIDLNGGVMVLDPLTLGFYDMATPYDSFTLRFNRYIADLDDDGFVNYVDFALLSQDWQLTEIESIADITGPMGVPDNSVDDFDLNIMIEQWLNQTTP